MCQLVRPCTSRRFLLVCATRGRPLAAADPDDATAFVRTIGQQSQQRLPYIDLTLARLANAECDESRETVHTSAAHVFHHTNPTLSVAEKSFRLSAALGCRSHLILSASRVLDLPKVPSHSRHSIASVSPSRCALLSWDAVVDTTRTSSRQRDFPQPFRRFIATNPAACIRR